jgi:hypothetical protein
MPRLPELDRPDEDFIVIHATPKMNVEVATLLSNAAYARFERAPGRDAMGIMARAIATISGALPEDLNVTDHFPEPFMVRFIYPHHRTTAVSRQEFNFKGHRIHIRPWRLEDGAEQVTLRQHVRLCIESLPLYAWTDAAAQQVIGRACSLDYIEDRCKRREYTKALCLWAWVEKPALVPRVCWVTLPGPPGIPGVQSVVGGACRGGALSTSTSWRTCARRTPRCLPGELGDGGFSTVSAPCGIAQSASKATSWSESSCGGTATTTTTGIGEVTVARAGGVR